MIKPIWTYGIQLWGCASNSNIEVIQRGQIIALRNLVGAYRYERNDDIHNDLRLPHVMDEIRRIADAHESRLHQHVNVTRHPAT